MVRNTLHICWSTPKSISYGDACLSFLSPADENRLEKRYPDSRIIRGREIVQKIQRNTRASYINIVAETGLSSLPDGRTFRKFLEHTGFSSWWLHPVSAKNCEHDQTFNRMLEICSVVKVAKESDTNCLHLHGAPYGTAETLEASGFDLKESDKSNFFLVVICAIVRALTKRCVKAVHEFFNVRIAGKLPEPAKGKVDILMTGYWDWSIGFDSDGNLHDRYFGELYHAVEQEGHIPCCLTWLDPKFGFFPRPKKLATMVDPLHKENRIILMQSFLYYRDILKQLFDFRPLFVYLRFLFKGAFARCFHHQGLNYSALFFLPMLEGFLDWSLPHGNLVHLAAGKVLSNLKPHYLVTFQEHYLHSRAIYAAARESSVLCATIQHASYSHNKTFLFVDPKIEFNGQPDGCSIPMPDTVFAMGKFGRSLFIECGYHEKDVIVTGSTRYALKPSTDPFPHVEKKILRVLIVCTLDFNIEMEMVEAAWYACRELVNIELKIRSHPDRPIHRTSSFQRFKQKITPTEGSLEEDLIHSDLVLFTSTTVAEEAFIRGLPVVQWLPRGYNGSALAEVADIPSFGSVYELREWLNAVQIDRTKLEPSSLFQREKVSKALFNQFDENAAFNISKMILCPHSAVTR